MEVKGVYDGKDGKICDAKEDNIEQIYSTLQRDFNILSKHRSEDNEERHDEMNELRAKYKVRLDAINATDKQREDITEYILEVATFLFYLDWAYEMGRVRRKKYSSSTEMGWHIF